VLVQIEATIRNCFRDGQQISFWFIERRRCPKPPGNGQLTVAAIRCLRHIGGVDLHWEKLCAVAAREIEATLKELPAPLRSRAEKLPVTFEPRPNTGLQRDGIAPDTLGLFTGAEFVDEETVSMPPQIILFLANIREFAEGDEERFCDEVRTTFLHELGHYLGLNEDDLTERGLE
jgi:predicted Zn-dependent protease with MMP-like domain